MRISRRRKSSGPLVLLLVVAGLLVGAYRLSRDRASYLPYFYPATQAAQPEASAARDVRLPVTRDVTSHEPWPEVEGPRKKPGQTLEVVHWLWCGQVFEFRHYLSVLSAVRLVSPLKLVFHYQRLPLVDKSGYNTWFEEMRDSLPYLELQEAGEGQFCKSTQTRLQFAVSLLQPSGGLVMGENVVLTRLRRIGSSHPWFVISSVDTGGFQGILSSMEPLTDESAVNKLLEEMSYPGHDSCGHIDVYNEAGSAVGQGHECVDTSLKHEQLFPRDIVTSRTHFARLARWLFYGRRDPVQVQTEGPPIPRVAHYVRLTKSADYGPELHFWHYLSVLSALHVAGMERVLVHADREPQGELWQRLVRAEKVTYVPLVSPESVYGNPVRVTAHVSDVARYLVLYKYGGVYQDWDVLWVQRIPDSLLRQPAVMPVDMLSYGWPLALNNGVLLARAQSHFLHHFLSSHRHYRDNDWAYNSIMMSYRTWELYPRTLWIDPYLQVMCWWERCYPPWLPGHQGDWTLNQTWAVHPCLPKPLVIRSPAHARNGTGPMARAARLVLAQSGGRQHLLDEGHGDR